MKGRTGQRVGGMKGRTGKGHCLTMRSPHVIVVTATMSLPA